MKLRQLISEIKIGNPKYDIRIDDNGTKRYYKPGTDHLHRVGGPAIEWQNGSKLWLQNGEYHRLDGPACEFAEGMKRWYINGKQYSEEEFNEKVKNLNEIKVTNPKENNDLKNTIADSINKYIIDYCIENSLIRSNETLIDFYFTIPYFITYVKSLMLRDNYEFQRGTEVFLMSHNSKLKRSEIEEYILSNNNLIQKLKDICLRFYIKEINIREIRDKVRDKIYDELLISDMDFIEYRNENAIFLINNKIIKILDDYEYEDKSLHLDDVLVSPYFEYFFIKEIKNGQD